MSNSVRSSRNQEPESSYRPSLVKLTNDISEIQGEVLSGFPSRRDVLIWLQRLTVRTLGEVPQSFYWSLARQFRLDIASTPGWDDEQIDQPVLLAGLMDSGARTRELEPEVVDELRERIVASMIRPSYHRAFRSLRKGAGEYIDESDDDTEHNPARQRHIAMRPALGELDRRQEDTLTAILAGLDDSAAILRWGERVELATHGELNATDKPEWVSSSVDVDLITRAHREPQTRELLTSSSEDLRPARELFAAVHLIPAFNKGVRDMAGRAGELPDTESKNHSPTQL